MNYRLLSPQVMRKATLALALVATLALASCAAPETPQAASAPITTPPASPKPTPSPTPSGITVSEKATCTLLIGPDEDGPLIQYINEITSADASDTAALASLITLKGDIEDVARTASPEIKRLVSALFSDDVNDFKAAGVELLTRCA